MMFAVYTRFACFLFQNVCRQTFFTFTIAVYTFCLHIILRHVKTKCVNRVQKELVFFVICLILHS